MERTFLKVKDLVDLYKIGKDVIYTAIHKKELKAYRPNKRDFIVKVSEFENWIQSKKY